MKNVIIKQGRSTLAVSEREPVAPESTLFLLVASLHHRRRKTALKVCDSICSDFQDMRSWLHHFLDAFLHFWQFGLWRVCVFVCVCVCVCVCVLVCVCVYSICAQERTLLGSMDLTARQRCNRWRTGLNVVAGSYGALAIPSWEIETHNTRKHVPVNVLTDREGFSL